MAAAEIVEYHHPAKLDAPSGTAARTAELMEGDVPDPLRPAAGDRRRPGGHPRRRRADAADHARDDGPHELHARRPARRAPGRGHRRVAARRARAPVVSLPAVSVAVTDHAVERFRQRVGGGSGALDVRPVIVGRVASAWAAGRVDVDPARRATVLVRDERRPDVVFVCRWDRPRGGAARRDPVGGGRRRGRSAPLHRRAAPPGPPARSAPRRGLTAPGARSAPLRPLARAQRARAARLPPASGGA